VKPLVVVEAGPAAVADARGELHSLGWSVSAEPGAAEVRDTVVADSAAAAEAVLAAVSGYGLLVDARAERDVLDRLCDDLRRLGHLDHRVTVATVLTPEQHALLSLLATGATLGAAATRLHLSRRSADRRLAAAREAFGVESTSAAVAAYQRRLMRLPRPAGA
jgi:DNA-binding NarL/FixJ family response regulator